jgi:hypothetical protein
MRQPAKASRLFPALLETGHKLRRALLGHLMANPLITKCLSAIGSEDNLPGPDEGQFINAREIVAEAIGCTERARV